MSCWQCQPRHFCWRLFLPPRWFRSEVIYIFRAQMTWLLPVWSVQTHMEVNTTAARCQLGKSEGIRAAFKRIFPRCRLSGWQKQKQSSLCVRAFVSVSPLFFGISAGGVIFSFAHVVSSSDRVTHFSHPNLSDWPTFCQQPKQQFESVTLTGRDSSASERLCLHSRCVGLCCEPKRAAKKAGSKASLAAWTPQSAT